MVINLDTVQFVAAQGRFTAFAAVVSQTLGIAVQRFAADSTLVELKITSVITVEVLARLTAATIMYQGSPYRMTFLAPHCHSGTGYNMATFERI